MLRRHDHADQWYKLERQGFGSCSVDSQMSSNCFSNWDFGIHEHQQTTAHYLERSYCFFHFVRMRETLTVCDRLSSWNVTWKCARSGHDAPQAWDRGDDSLWASPRRHDPPSLNHKLASQSPDSRLRRCPSFANSNLCPWSMFQSLCHCILAKSLCSYMKSCLTESVLRYSNQRPELQLASAQIRYQEDTC